MDKKPEIIKEENAIIEQIQQLIEGEKLLN